MQGFDFHNIDFTCEQYKNDKRTSKDGSFAFHTNSEAVKISSLKDSQYADLFNVDDRMTMFASVYGVAGEERAKTQVPFNT